MVTVVAMHRRPHENVATVLVDTLVLRDLELRLSAHDAWVWPVATAPICTDGPRRAFQIRHRLLEAHRGEWDLAADWCPVWISFGESWRSGEEPLPWAAHSMLWEVLGHYPDHVRYHRRLVGVPPLTPHREPSNLAGPRPPRGR